MSPGLPRLPIEKEPQQASKFFIIFPTSNFFPFPRCHYLSRRRLASFFFRASRRGISRPVVSLRKLRNNTVIRNGALTSSALGVSRIPRARMDAELIEGAVAASQPRRCTPKATFSLRRLLTRRRQWRHGLPQGIVFSLIAVALILETSIAGADDAPSSPIASDETSFPPIAPDEASSTPNRSKCEVVVSVTKTKLSFARVFNRWFEEKQLVSVGFRVFRAKCFFPKEGSLSRFVDLCKQRAKRICGKLELQRIVFEIVERDRRWLAPALREHEAKLLLENKIRMLLFIKCQNTTPIDKKSDSCQGGREFKYYNLLYDSYRHSTIYGRSQGEISSYERTHVAGENVFAGNVVVTWSRDMTLNCTEGVAGDWSFLGIQNSLSPLLARDSGQSDATGLVTANFPDACTLSNGGMGHTVCFRYHDIGSYKGFFDSTKAVLVKNKGPYEFKRIAISEMFPFGSSSEADNAKFVHIRLMSYSLLPNWKTQFRRFFGPDVETTTVNCRAGEKTRSVQKCLEKVRAEIEDAQAVFVSAERTAFFWAFVSVVLPSLTNPDTGAVKTVFNKYRFIINGKADFLRGVTPQVPTKEKEPVAVDPKFFHLITAPVAPVFWQLYSPVRHVVHEAVFGNSRRMCAGMLKVRFSPSEWNLLVNDKSFYIDPELYWVSMMFHFFRPSTLDNEDTEIATTYSEVKLVRIKEYEAVSLDIACFLPSAQGIVTMNNLSILKDSVVTFRPLSELNLRSTLMFHV